MKNRTNLRLIAAALLSVLIFITTGDRTVMADTKPIAVGTEYAAGDEIVMDYPCYIWGNKKTKYYELISGSLVVNRIAFDSRSSEWTVFFKYDAITWLTHISDSDSTEAVGIRVVSGDGSREQPYEFEVIHARTVSITETESGTVTSDKTNAGVGQTVTLTVQPNPGYTLKSLSVNDESGAAVEVTKIDDTHYSFVMPSSSVTVSAVFKALPDPSHDEESESTEDAPVVPADNVVTCQMASYPSGYEWNEAAKACQPGYLDAEGVFHSQKTVPDTADR